MGKSKRKERYLANKKAKCGEMIICPICGTEFKKKQYSQAFCCSTCKDKYHNDKGDRHDSGYYRRYNMEHPERLERIGININGYDYEDEAAYYDDWRYDDSECWCDNPQLGI